MFEEKYELLLQKASKLLNPCQGTNLDTIAILIQMTTNLEEQSAEEKAAYWKIYYKYHSTIKNQLEKRKWEKEFDRIFHKYKNNFAPSWNEKEENDPKFRELYEKTKEEFYSTPK